MPYILSELRKAIDPHAPGALNAGELNFQITQLIRAYWSERKDYRAINDILGALEGAKLEFYRRVAAPYENTKIAENGDVY